MDKRLKNVLKFYVLATQLKDKIRSGWDDEHWNISKERRESVAEHVYSACMLAIAMDSEFETNLDIKKVVMMLVLHELGEVEIGDITPFDGVSREEKVRMEREAIRRMLGDLVKGEEYYDLLLEFDDKKTKEAIFAYYCDKMDADLQAKIYQDMGCQNPLGEQENNVAFKDERVQEIIKDGGVKQVFDIWYEFNRPVYRDNENFARLLDYVKGVDTRGIVDSCKE